MRSSVFSAALCGARISVLDAPSQVTLNASATAPSAARFMCTEYFNSILTSTNGHPVGKTTIRVQAFVTLTAALSSHVKARALALAVTLASLDRVLKRALAGLGQLPMTRGETRRHAHRKLAKREDKSKARVGRYDLHVCHHALHQQRGRGRVFVRGVVVNEQPSRTRDLASGPRASAPPSVPAAAVRLAPSSAASR